MKYMGSKSKISSEIKEFIMLNRTSGQTYVEPFCGGCNMLDKIKGRRIAADNNKYLIAIWQGLQEDLTRPYDISKTMYEGAKLDFKNGTNVYYSDFEIGWIGFMASFNGKFFNGYVSDNMNKVRDYQTELIYSIEKQISKIKDVEFFYCDYKDLIIPDNSIIYCDIPYINATNYEINTFNHSEFYDYAEHKSNQRHKVFISEYWMPEDRFTKVWQKQIKSILSNNDQLKIESLFIPKNQKINKQLSIFDCC